MATLSHNKKNGTRSVQVPLPAWAREAGRGRRATIRLGKMPVRAAERFRARVHDIQMARRAGQPLSAETLEWLAALDDEMHDRLVRACLVEPRIAPSSTTIEAVVRDWLAASKPEVKPATLTRMEQAGKALGAHFGRLRTVDSVTAKNAEAFRASMRAKYAAATVSRTVLYARHLWRWAMGDGRCAENPFEAVRAGSQANPSRKAFVTRETIEKVIAAAPDPAWRALICLSRYCGLRVPSEALLLTWDDIDWADGRLRVKSPKTERHEGLDERFVPIFPEVRPHLQALYDAAPEGEVRLFERFPAGTTLNTRLRRIIARAGVEAWPKAWHNLRASCQTELAMRYPISTVCSWIGNSRLIANAHYLQVTDADWQRAIGSAPEGGAESGAQAVQNAVPSAHDRERQEPTQ